MPPNLRPSRPYGHAGYSLFLMEAGFVLAWSSGFVGARFGADHTPLFLLLFWRCVVAAAILAPYSIGTLRRFDGRVVARHALVGLLAMAGYLAFVVKSVEFGVPPGLAALIAALQPLTTAALAGPLLGEPVAGRQWVGLGIGLGGVTLALSGALELGSAPAWAYAMPFLGMVSLVSATFVQKAARGPVLPAAADLFVQSAASIPIFAILAVAEGRLLPIATTGFAMSILWVVVLSTFAAYGLYWACLRRTSATRVGSLLYLTPPVTMAWAWLMFGEGIGWTMLTGLIVSLCGVVLASTSRRSGMRCA